MLEIECTNPECDHYVEPPTRETEPAPPPSVSAGPAVWGSYLDEILGLDSSD